MAYYSHVSTGWNSLDCIIDHLRRGDNVVWQVDNIDSYRKMVSNFVNHAIANHERVVYMRFGRHGPLLEPRPNLCIYTLNVAAGFESFSSEVHSIITREGKDIFYVFDSLSDLLYEWATDLMIVNFFFVTCPYLYELRTIAYFAILRNCHSFKAIARIRETTQVLIDIYSHQRKLCVHPIKIQDRYSPTMFFPHIKARDQLVPVINSVEATQLFSNLLREKAVNAQRIMDYWDRIFIQAQKLLESGATSAEKKDKVEQLSRLVLSRNKRVLEIIRRFMSLEDLLQIKERLIGTGFIGGKALGMLLSRKILMQDQALDWAEILEHHDSFYIGSDVFYSYIVQNGWWKLFMAHKTREGFFTKAAELKANILEGRFPESIRERFQLMLEYFGQSPIIVRSSSLLEDAFGSAFAGKYDSFFCVNQASPDKRYENFEEALKRIFASTLNEDALAYRLQRGLDQMDEQMAILVQRVSGAYHKNCFFPELAGVGLSHNPYVWKKNMDPAAGMLRLVMGLGTRAVNRVENDYPRIVAMDEPSVKPLGGLWDLKKYSQHYVDYLNLEENELQTTALRDLVAKQLDIHLESIGVRDTESRHYAGEGVPPDQDQWILTFDHFFTHTPFIRIMAGMLKRLEQAYATPVEVEFTVNTNAAQDIQINLLQCRPFQTIGGQTKVAIPEKIPPANIFIQTEGNFMGGNVSLPVGTIIWVDPSPYANLSLSDKYSVARLIGKLNRKVADRRTRATMLMGPGRWGTQTPAMGVPVTFSEINHITALVEISYRAGSLIPDLSFGTHFFHDLTEANIFYAAVYPERSDVTFHPEWIAQQPNALSRIDPEAVRFDPVVKVIHLDDGELILQSDIQTQQMICYRV
ncbi:PpsA2: pyruvate phosphate dikinase, PEP/pyruvate-binding [Desulfosarcina variabilis str. Montpellier]|uniref:PEP/pyruvate-binding domain-containing protein n=1 Tax=Desulfosarcina variabilis TaxID=2300 RepID=UPI003AFA385A